MSRTARLARHSTVSTRLALLSDRQLAALLDEAAPAGAGIGGTTASLDVEGVPVFVKTVPLTDLERRPEHVRSTANLFELPTFYQYGIGSAGFGAWRELAVHIMTTNWILESQCQGFPILYHWRVLPQSPSRSSTAAEPTESTTAELTELDRAVAYWDGSPAVRARLAAIARSSASLVLFMERIPQTVHAWLSARAAAGGRAAASAYALVERDLQAGTAFMNSHGMLHFDAHFDNLLTDGRRIYFADFGLAICSRFDLTPAESAFFRRHLSYDRCYTTTHLTRWLVTNLRGTTPAECDEFLRDWADGRGAADLSTPAARILTRHVPIAVVMSDFYRSLLAISRTTPYPVEELRRVGGGRGRTRAALFGID